jgi:predicted nucleotidyltransferase
VLTVPDAFEKFKSRLEISTSEQEDASRRQQKIREQVREGLAVERDFLTGSYARHTKTKPLKDVDIFVVLGESESDYLDKGPDVILDRLIEILSPHYPSKASKGNRSVKIDRREFATADEQVLSFDIVPAFVTNGDYTIPDRRQGGWIKTNPDIHRDKATAANEAFAKQWKPVVKMIKKWNDHNDKPVKPSFLLEVMALKLLDPPWAGSYARELRQFFATAAQALDEEWADPAGLGPPVTARLAENSWELLTAKQALRDAEAAATEALRLEQSGRTGSALDTWQELFGTRFAKS